MLMQVKLATKLVKIETKMLKSTLYDYSTVHIIVKGTITIIALRTDAAPRTADEIKAKIK